MKNKLNDRKKFIHEFQISHNRISEHKNKFLNSPLLIDNLEMWKHFITVIINLYYNYTFNIDRLKKAKIVLVTNDLDIRNLRYISNLYNEVININDAIKRSSNENLFNMVNSRLNYLKISIALNEIHELSKLDLKKGINVETLQDEEGNFIFVSDNYREQFNNLVALQKSSGYLKHEVYNYDNGNEINNDEKKAV